MMSTSNADRHMCRCTQTTNREQNCNSDEHLLSPLPPPSSSSLLLLLLRLHDTVSKPLGAPCARVDSTRSTGGPVRAFSPSWFLGRIFPFPFLTSAGSAGNRRRGKGNQQFHRVGVVVMVMVVVRALVLVQNDPSDSPVPAYPVRVGASPTKAPVSPITLPGNSWSLLSFPWVGNREV